MDRRWADVSFVTEREAAAGVEGRCHLFGQRTEWLIKQQQSEGANLISAARAKETTRRPGRVTYRKDIKSSLSA